MVNLWADPASAQCIAGEFDLARKTQITRGFHTVGGYGFAPGPLTLPPKIMLDSKPFGMVCVGVLTALTCYWAGLPAWLVLALSLLSMLAYWLAFTGRKKGQ